jgi:type II restriction enzyme
VGTANAADAGLDMWANFGPAVQVKHLSLSPEDVDDICTYIQADQIIIVCKSMEAISIESVLQQVGLGGRIRGIITEQHLIKWYGIACGGKYYGTLGADLLEALRNEFALEFPLTQDLQVHAFLAERHYDVSQLTDLWSLQRIQEE